MSEKDHLIDLDAEESEAEASATKKRSSREKGGSGGGETLKIIDRRFWARKDSSDEGEGGEEQDILLSQIAARDSARAETLQRSLEENEQKFRETTEAYLHLKEEFDRFRSRSEREGERRLLSAKGNFLKALLPVLDSFDRALQTLPKERSESDPYRAGMEMMRAQLEQFVASSGLERVTPTGEAFDPRVAEAVEAVTVTDAAQDNRVLETLFPGYRLGETLLRPASVRVGKKK